ncbi:hypothetical protein [Mucilaginibacter ginsenosidivorax]|uniref:Uncharacterized protein n=1 Tax=Mucilaginibacter ginsenosidivorax TaxID=862126 RepID=A0A5B8W4D7_9SPHI|nr:hypothetical protein [Mucilaginibacter ginsenosidivorax]QEC77825.1 hypothetical protein FSB76_18465 [Mucilaginibacter ginsenosidivorax]
MKEYILSQLQSVQLVMDGLDKLREEHDPFTTFWYFWHVLEFINWMKANHPDDYELYELETDFEFLDEFGDAYVNIFDRGPVKFYRRYDDGIYNIDVPIPKMIKKLYDYVINLQEEELAKANAALANGTASFSQVMDMLAIINTNVNKVGTAVGNIPVIDPADLAEKFVEHVANPPKPEQKMTKKEQLKAEATKRIAQEDLKELQKRHNQGN